MKIKKLYILTTVAAIAIGGLTAAKIFADNDSNAPARPLQGQIFQRIAKKLNLTDDQKSQINTVLASEKDTLKKNLLGQLQDARQRLVCSEKNFQLEFFPQ